MPPYPPNQPVSFVRLMTLLAERSLDRWEDPPRQWHPKLTQAERGEQCCVWAQQFREVNPVLADELWAVAQQYGSLMYLGGGSPGRMREPGEDDQD